MTGVVPVRSSRVAAIAAETLARVRPSTRQARRRPSASSSTSRPTSGPGIPGARTTTP